MAIISNPSVRAVTLPTGHVVPRLGNLTTTNDIIRCPDNWPTVNGLFLSGQVALDVAFLQVSPPDHNGLCSLGTSCDAAKAAATTARVVIAEINAQMPRTTTSTCTPACEAR